MDGFILLLLVTVILRGLGAGMIAGILLLTMPARRRLDPAAYAHAIRTMYEGWGVKVYAITAGLGLILTIIALPWALTKGESAWVVGLLIASLAATLAGFAGTGGAYPAMRRLWTTPENAQQLVGTLLDRFGRWGVLSAASHLIAFIAIAPALVAL